MLILGRIALAKHDNAMLLELCHLIQPWLQKDNVTDDNTAFDDILQFAVTHDLISMEDRECFMQ